MSKPLIALLRSVSSGMTPALARVADAVLARPDAALYQSITELAESAGSSEASVMRFCREQGFAGFQDFKLALARELARLDRPETGERPADAVQSLVETAFVALQETERLLSRESLDIVAARLLASPRIGIFGVAASAVTARYLEYKLIRVGIHCRALDDAHLAMMTASIAEDGALHVIISSSGTTIDGVRLAERARQNGAFVVAITNRSKSPLVSLCDVALIANWPETPLTGGAYPSKISQLLIVDAILAHVLNQAPERRDIMDRTAGSVSDKSY